MLRFAIVIILTSLLLVAIVRTGVYFTSWFREPSFTNEIVLFLAVATLAIYYKLTVTRQELFVQFYLLSIAVKVLAYLAFVFFIVLKDRSSAFPNVVFFMTTYVTFTVLEIVFLFPKISGRKEAK